MITNMLWVILKTRFCFLSILLKEIPKQIENLEHLKDKTIVNVCTGGVRCEKGFKLFT